MFDHSHPELGPGSDKENNKMEREKTSISNSSQEFGRREENIYKALGWEDADDIDDLA
jgi:hypothetical protein